MNTLLAQLPDPSGYQSVGWLMLCIAAIIGIAVLIQKAVIQHRVLSGNLPPQPRRNSDDEKIVTEANCKALRDAQKENTDLLIKLRSVEHITAYEAEAKKARKILHDQMTDLKVGMGQLDERTQRTNKTLDAINDALQDVSTGLANLSGLQGKG